MAASRLQPSKAHNHFALDENRPLGIGANFHDDPLCRSSLRKSHTLGLDAPLPADYAPHTSYNYSGAANDFSWMYQTSSVAYGASSMQGAKGSSCLASQESNDAVLRFLAYTRDSIVESNVERTRIRRMGIVFHTQDQSIAIREAKQPNSGMSQGQVLLRQRVPRRPDNVSDVLTIDDFRVGDSVTIYGVVYHIVDCDERTRLYFREVLKKSVPDFALPWPTSEDSYNATAQQNLTFKPKKLIPTHIMDQKRVVEQLTSGIISKHPPDEVHMAKQFLRNKINEHLQFAALWDDRDKISGDLRRCAIRYFLENDTIEVIEVRPDNAGREGGCKLLCRQRVTKDGSEVPVHKGLQNTFGVILKDNFLEAADIKIGETLKIHQRDYLVYDADEFTRNCMRETYNIELPPPADVTEIVRRGHISPPLQVPPPHDGFGTEEDSLQNWKHLTLKPPRIDVAKQERENGRVMVFAASLVAPCSPEDAGRKFVICFYRATDEVEVIETSVRNSGIVGGKFLVKRRHLKTLPDGRQVPYTPDDFVVGKTVTILNRSFSLDEIDQRSDRLVRGIADAVTEDRVRELLVSFKVMLHSKFLRMHEAYRQIAPQGALTIKEIREFFRSSSCAITEEEALYLVQYMAPGGSGIVSFEDFVRVMDIPNSKNVDESSMHPRSIKNINMTLDTTLARATLSAADTALRRNLTQQLVDKLNQRRGTVQEVFRLLAGHSANGKLNRSAFSVGLKEQLHFNLPPLEHAMLVDIVFSGIEDAAGDITVKQFHEFLERYQ